jgi:transcriptional regulator with PAS, ATPase and Fis domain
MKPATSKKRAHASANAFANNGLPALARLLPVCSTPDLGGYPRARREERHMKLGERFVNDTDEIRKVAMQTLFERLETLCEGAVAVDQQAHVVWMNDKYAKKLGLPSAEQALGRDIEDVIPNSLMRQVVQTGEPILLDIMEFGVEQFVVTRMPLNDEQGKVIGAIGFVLYDRLQHLKPLVTKFAQLQTELATVQRRIAEGRRARYTFASVVGSSPACVELKRQARRAAQLEATVLLLGETGTGKELLAHAIHTASPRSAKPFVAMNMSAVPETLMEAEFFGAAPGAYTGADRHGRDGKFKLADGGTLFLDEVGDMPTAVQSKLLRVLQEQEVEPLGSNRVVRVDVRVIAATSRDLEEQIRQGKFRADLYYRLNVLSILLPPLRDRLQDLSALCELTLAQIAERTGMPQREMADDAISLLGTYGWPGNIRELRNVLEKAAMYSDNRRLEAADFVQVLPALVPSRQAVLSSANTLSGAVAQAERAAILAALEASRGNKSSAAQMLGVSRATLYEKLAQLGIGSHG